MAGHLVQVETQPVEMADLGRDDWFIGPSGALYEVARPAGEHPSGWTDVTNLSMSEAAEQAARQRGDAEPGMSPRDGFFAYSVPVTVDRVIGVAEQAPVDDAHAALLGALTERWVSARDAAVDAVVARAGEATRSMISRRSPVAEIADARESRDTSDRDDARER